MRSRVAAASTCDTVARIGMLNWLTSRVTIDDGVAVIKWQVVPNPLLMLEALARVTKLSGFRVGMPLLIHDRHTDFTAPGEELRLYARLMVSMRGAFGSIAVVARRQPHQRLAEVVRVDAAREGVRFRVCETRAEAESFLRRDVQAPNRGVASVPGHRDRSGAQVSTA